jgi:hypothetical protein
MLTALKRRSKKRGLMPQQQQQESRNAVVRLTDRVSHHAGVAAALVTRLRRVVPSETREVAYFLGMARCYPDMAPVYLDCARHMHEAQERNPLAPDEIAAREALLADPRVRILDEAFTAFVQGVACADPELVSNALAGYRAMREKNAAVQHPTPQLQLGTAIQDELITRMEAGLRYAAPDGEEGGES